jgi:Cof subfamily protein (haloacid dehalogenase superfamily)
MTIKLIALDIDGTTLMSDGSLSKRNRNALIRATQNGIHVVIATGRCYDALPRQLTELKGIRYALTSNGAQTKDLHTGQTLDGNYLTAEAVAESAELLRAHTGFMVEIFTDGKAYMDKAQYDGVCSGEISWRSRNYVRDTRSPVEDVIDFMLQHRHTIENINIFFEHLLDKDRLKPYLDLLNNVTITSSFDNNWEIGGATTNKGAALQSLARMLYINKEEILACGDSPNDEEMLKVAGIPVAVGNAKESVRRLAIHIVAENDQDGVAEAIEKFAL